MKRLSLSVLLTLGLLGSPTISMAGDSVESILESRVLEKTYNSVLVDFLVEEGKQKLPEPVRKKALDQLVLALKAKTTITKDEQLTAALGSLVGIAMGLSDDDVVGGAGVDVAGSYAAEYESWVDAAFKLLHAEYKDAAATFFVYGMKMIPYSQIQARCVKGLALARPDEAYALLMKMLEEPNSDIVSMALRMLGHLSTDKNISDERKNTIIDTLIEHTHGILHSTEYRAAIYGLIVSKDPCAVEALSRFKKGIHDEYDQRAAFRGLLLTFGDKSIVAILKKFIKSGLMNLHDDYDKLWAGKLLIEAGEEAGFEWAIKMLTPKKKSFLSKKNKGPDFRPQVVSAIVAFGGERGREVLSGIIPKYKDDEWLKIWIATGLLELGDTSYIELVRNSLSNPNWDYTAVRITEALAKHGDYSGIPFLRQLIEKRPPKKSGGQKLLGFLAGKKDNATSKEKDLEHLRINIAGALARLNQKDGVPLLILMLSDKAIYVRSAAARALTRMDDSSALDGLIKAVSVDYGIVNGQSRNPGIQAHIARIAALRFPNDSRKDTVLDNAQKSAHVDLRFLALAAK